MPASDDSGMRKTAAFQSERCIMSKLTKVVALSVFAFLAAFSATRPADAVGILNSCVLSQIGLDSNGMRMKPYCSNDPSNVYYTNPGGSCATAPMDEVKMWHSMAMSAFLSGRRLNIVYDSTACRSIVNLDITN